jgi:ATP-dependent helicase/nuclease subunit B
VDTDVLRPGVAWVAATRRLAHFLRARHDDHCTASGLEVWPTPDIVTWSTLVERMHALDRQAGRIAGRWLPDAAARLVWERIAEQDSATGHLVSPGLLGRAAYDSWRRLHAFEIPLRAVADDDRPEARTFARWASTYSEWLDRHRWVDESLAVERVHPASAGPALELVGFDALTPAQQAFFARLERAGVNVTQRSEPLRQGLVTRVECRDRTAELDTAARWAAQRLDGRTGIRLAIVVPGLAPARDEVRRIIERVLAPDATVAGGPAPESRAFELAAARPLSARPLVAAALETIDAFSRAADVALAGRLLRSPFLADAVNEADARARLDARIRRSESPDLGLPRLQLLASEHHCPLLARALRSGLDLAAAWPRRAPPSGWSRLWSQLLGAVGWPGDDLDSDEHQARQRWQQLVGEFGACDDYAGTISAAAAAALLRDMARGTLFEPQELRTALTIIDPETCAGMDFDGLWVCGLEAGQWPAPAAPDPFLPRDWQARQGVPGATAEGSAAAAQRVLERLCRSADEVILSNPQFDEDAPLLPSVFVARLPPSSSPATWSCLALAGETFAARPELERLVDGVMPPVSEQEASRGGAKLLELQAACPFRAQAELRLGARALEEPEPGIAASDRGDLVHAVLARLWNDIRNHSSLCALSAADLLARVRSAIAAETAIAQRSAQGVMRHLLEIEAGWLEARVLELLEQDRARPPFTVESLEQDHKVATGGLDLTLRIDRVDRLQDGSVAVIDYKTGGDAEPDAWLGERPRLPQLPLYAEAVGRSRVAALAFGRVRAGETGYAGLAREANTIAGLKDPTMRSWPKEYASWTELQAAWERRLRALAEEYVQGDARLAPDPSHACKYCHLAALCRIGESGLEADAEGAADE